MAFKRVWTDEAEEIVAKYFFKYGKEVNQHIDEIVKELHEKGYTDKDAGKVKAKLVDLGKIKRGADLSHVADSTIKAYKKIADSKVRFLDQLNGYIRELYGNDAPILDYDTEVDLSVDSGTVQIGFDPSLNNFVVPGLSTIAPKPSKNKNHPFCDKLFELLAKDGRTGQDLYGKDEDYIDRRYLSRMQQGKAVTKANILRVAIMLRLDLETTNELLGLAGFGLSRGLRKDIIIMYAIEHKIYTIREINDTLDDYGEDVLFK